MTTLFLEVGRWRSVMEGECSEGAEGWLLVRVHVPELNVQKSLQFPRDQLIWDVKQQCLAALPKICALNS
uniref:SFRICE_010575 n=1 Tax=Spodoptera frugiperda TaxID=7108 RepID=A0A2H1VMV0_SPOFR